MTEYQSSNRSIVKVTSLFGGVQIFLMLTSIIRGKFVALFIGATGMGINGMFVSAITMITQVAGLGLNFSAVRDISLAKESGDVERIDSTITVVRKWLVVCSLSGALILILVSNLLSKLSFGNSLYTLSFVLLSLVVSLSILTNGNVAILQGLRRMQEMAKASLWGAIVGLITSIPLYWYLGIKGIVPALIIAAITAYGFSYFYTRNIIIKRKINFREVYLQGGSMAKLGIVMMLANVIGSIVTYVINTYISNFGSLSDLGLYQAGLSITNQYSGVVFTAMAVDYFPRLSAVNTNTIQLNRIVNQQAEIVTTIITPILMFVMLAAPIIIHLLLSVEFIVLKHFIFIMAFSLIFKAASFNIGYISFAKGDKFLFFWFEGVFGSLLILISAILGYYFYGLNGIAIANLLSNVLYLIVIYLITNRRYGFKLQNGFLITYSKLVLFTGALFVTVLVFDNIYGYIFGISLTLWEFFFSFKHLDRILGLKSYFRDKFNKISQEANEE